MPSCVHGLPGWCLSCAGVPRQEKPEFRRRRESGEQLSFGHGSREITKEAAKQSKMGDLTISRTGWRKAQDDRAMAEFLKLFNRKR